MSRSLYSLILNDEVVAKVDLLAARHRTSRSEMITRILAEHVSVRTPEQHRREILERLSMLLGSGDTFILTPGSDTTLSARSSLAYKYRPSVKYSLELGRSGAEIGQLRVSLRTQNPTLLGLFDDFCRIWAQIETERIGPSRYLIQPGRFARELRLRIRQGSESYSPQALGEMIGRYVNLLDTGLKTYFEQIAVPARAIQSLRELYAAYAGSAGELL